jgi:methyl-accepting chemotaxis protein
MRNIRFTIGRRLALLGCIGLVVAVLSNGTNLLLGSHGQDLQKQERQYQQAQQLVRELDTRASELKVDGYKALLSTKPADLKSDLTDDAGQVTTKLDALDKLTLSTKDESVASTLRAAFAEYVTGIGAVIDAAVADPVKARANFTAIQDANDKTDSAVGDAEDQLDAGALALIKKGQDTFSLSFLVTFLMLGIGAAIVLAATVVLGRSMNRRVKVVVNALNDVAGGDLSHRIPEHGGDEIADMAGALNTALGKISDAFTRITGTADQLAGESTSLQGVAVELSRAAAETSAQADVVARTADDVSQNVQAVAAGGEEMGASIGEISRNANEAARVATGAVQAVESTTATMSKLGDSSREIGDVVRLITSIAEQTNLLALNATIEAARAGDAGKGFAVVADEVKQLAQETARATEDISKRVETIQEDADQAAQAIQAVAGVITRINEFQTTIASAVEEQTATTQAINAGVSEAATGSGQIARSIGGVAQSAGATTASIDRASESARELSGMSDELGRLVGSFRF